MARLENEEARVADHVAAEVLGRIADRPGILLLSHLLVHAKNAQVSVKETHLSREHQVELQGLDYLFFQVDQFLFPVWFLLFKTDNVDDQVQRRTGCLVELCGYENCDGAQAYEHGSRFVRMGEVKKVSIGQGD